MAFTYDMHVHTKETSPCGKISGAEMVHMYKDAGYSGVVVTDHYFDGFFEPMADLDWNQKIEKYLIGYRSAALEGIKIGLNVILGMELRFQGSINDFLVYGIDEKFLTENIELYKLDLRRFREIIKGRNILVFQAHPYRAGGLPANPEFLDGVEVYNGNPRNESYNDKALSFAKQHELRMIAGSDFHRHEDIAKGGTVFSEEIKDAQMLTDALLSGKVMGLARF